MRFVLVLSFAAVAIAQTNSRTGVLGGVIGPTPAGMTSTSGWTFASLSPGLPGGAVTGAPYSAEQLTEHVQTLADGTHIKQPAQKAIFYRDSQGRSRVERTFPMPPGVAAKPDAGPSIIEIVDPVSGIHYTLQPRDHTARKMSLPPAPPPPPPGSITAPGGRYLRMEARVAVPGPAISVPDDQTLHPQLSHEPLGTQTVEGVVAEGSRTTVIYPIGAFGNDRPITTVSETWTSPELKMVILSKNSDPRSGELTTRLVNISRAEPDPSLFQIPSDYEVIENEAMGPKR